MSIKNAIRRLETKLIKNASSHPMTFIIPYCKDASQTKKIKQKLLQGQGLENSDSQVIFVIDFAQVA